MTKWGVITSEDDMMDALVECKLDERIDSVRISLALFKELRKKYQNNSSFMMFSVKNISGVVSHSISVKGFRTIVCALTI